MVLCCRRDPGDCLSPVLVWSLHLLLSKDFRSGMGSDGFQTQRRGTWIPGKQRAEKVLASAISVDGRKEWINPSQSRMCERGGVAGAAKRRTRARQSQLALSASGVCKEGTPANTARTIDERASSEDRKHTSGGLFVAVGNEGRLAQAWEDCVSSRCTSGSQKAGLRILAGSSFAASKEQLDTRG